MDPGEVLRRRAMGHVRIARRHGAVLWWIRREDAAEIGRVAGLHDCAIARTAGSPTLPLAWQRGLALIGIVPRSVLRRAARSPRLTQGIQG